MKKALSVLFCVLMIAFAAAEAINSLPASGFSDVGDDRWSASSIEYAVKKSYMNGVGGGLFDPGGRLTRAMVATVLWRRGGSPAPTAPSGFTDVACSAWYADAVAWAEESGIVNGTTATTFAPDAFITREQLAAMMFRFSGTAPISIPERADLSPFADGGTVSVWAKEALGWAVEAGLINGTGCGLLAPGGFATREQFAAIMERYDKTFTLIYSEPVVLSRYTEKEYPLVTGADFYVSTDGNDENDGSFEAPFRTFERAAEAVRDSDKFMRSGITVAFMAGEYGPLSVELTEQNGGTKKCPVTYCAYGDGDVVFSDGFDYPSEDFEPLSDAEKTLFNEKETDKIKKTDVSSAVAAGTDPENAVLFDENGLLDEARYPNKFPDDTDQLLCAGEYDGPKTMKISSPILARRLARYSPEEFRTMKIRGYILAGYRKDTFTASGYDAGDNILTVIGCLTSPYDNDLRDWSGVTGTGIEICVTNIPYELDRKNEYWIDPGTNTLYVYEPDGTYSIPSGGTMITMSGVNHVTFSGLTFRNSGGGFIGAEMCRDVTLELCSFLNTSADRGVSFRDHPSDVPMDLEVRECTFANSYGHALYVDGHNTGEHRFDKRENVVFDNNLVRTANMVSDVMNGVHFEKCGGVEVTHNRFERCSRGAVSFGQSYDILVEYNDFDSALCDSHDSGVIYTEWICDARNCVVRYNFFGYVQSRGAGQYGLYLDEFSSGFEIYSNLFYKTGNYGAMFSLGRDNVFRDNVLVQDEYNGTVWWGASTRDQIDEAGSVEAARAGSWDIKNGERYWNEFFDNCKNYPRYRSVIEERWPEMLRIHLDYDRIDDPYFALNQTTSVTDNVIIRNDLILPSADGMFAPPRTYEKIYAAFERNRAFTLRENPVFVNPTKGDYRIRAGADFPDIRFEKIGRY